MTANDSISYLNNLIIAIILIIILLIKNLLMLINQLWLEKLRQILKLLNYQNIFSKDYTKNWSREIFIVDSDWVNYKFVIIWNQTVMLEKKPKIVLHLSNYATKKELTHATGIDMSDLASKKDFIALKAEVDKLGINKSVNATTLLVWII